MWPFTKIDAPTPQPSVPPTPPVTCSAAGKMGAAARKAEGRALIRERSRELYRQYGRVIPAALVDEA